MLISQRQLVGANWVTWYYGQDGSENVRQLFDNTGSVTDTFDYDAFGILIGRTGTTANSYLYRSQQFDSDLGFYYNRARYYDQTRGRFLSRDAFNWVNEEPRSLHKYLYANSDPISFSDSSGYFGEQGISQSIPASLAASQAQSALLRQGAITLTNKAGQKVTIKIAQQIVKPILQDQAKKATLGGLHAAIFDTILDLVLILFVVAATSGGFVDPPPPPPDPVDPPDVNDCQIMQVGSHTVGRYRCVGGHHPHQQAARSNNRLYNGRQAKTIRFGTFDHDAISSAQRTLNAAARRSGAPYTLSVEENIQRQAMRTGNISDVEIEAILLISRAELAIQGALEPTRIPGSR
jgi:RHS repeat-associated protein